MTEMQSIINKSSTLDFLIFLFTCRNALPDFAGSLMAKCCDANMVATLTVEVPGFLGQKWPYSFPVLTSINDK